MVLGDPDFVNAPPKLRIVVRKIKKWLRSKVPLCQEERAFVKVVYMEIQALSAQSSAHSAWETNALCMGNHRILHEKLKVSLGKHKVKLPPSECKIIRMGCLFPTLCGKEHGPANQTAVPF